MAFRNVSVSACQTTAEPREPHWGHSEGPSLTEPPHHRDTAGPRGRTVNTVSLIKNQVLSGLGSPDSKFTSPSTGTAVIQASGTHDAHHIQRACLQAQTACLTAEKKCFLLSLLPTPIHRCLFHTSNPLWPAPQQHWPSWPGAEPGHPRLEVSPPHSGPFTAKSWHDTNPTAELLLLSEETADHTVLNAHLQEFNCRIWQIALLAGPHVRTEVSLISGLFHPVPT